MTEQEHIEQIRQMFVDRMSATAETVAAAERAVRAYPNCAALWLLHGQVTLASESDDESTPRIAEQSFLRALQLDSNCAATHRDLAVHYAGIAENWDNAALHNRCAAELSGENIA